MKYQPGLCPAYLRRRNGRLMRRGQIEKQKLTYVRRTRRPVLVRFIINDLLDSQLQFHEYANLLMEQMHRSMSEFGKNNLTHSPIRDYYPCRGNTN